MTGRLRRQELIDEHIYLVPRMFPVYKQNLIQKYGFVYDLCLYSTKFQANTTGKMVNFFVLQSDKRDPYYPYEIWQTSPQKIVYGSREILKSIDVTEVYARKIQKWFTRLRKNNAAKFISERLFQHMIEPGKGWLYKKAFERWNVLCSKNTQSTVSSHITFGFT